MSNLNQANRSHHMMHEKASNYSGSNKTNNYDVRSDLVHFTDNTTSPHDTRHVPWVGDKQTQPGFTITAQTGFRVGASFSFTLGLFCCLIALLYSRFECCGPKYAVSEHGNNDLEQLKLVSAAAKNDEKLAKENEAGPKKEFEYLSGKDGVLALQRANSVEALEKVITDASESKKMYRHYATHYADSVATYGLVKADVTEKAAAHEQCYNSCIETANDDYAKCSNNCESKRDDAYAKCRGEMEESTDEADSEKITECNDEKIAMDTAQEKLDKFIWVAINADENLEQFAGPTEFQDKVQSLSHAYALAEAGILSAQAEKDKWANVDDSEHGIAEALAKWEAAIAVTAEKTVEREGAENNVAEQEHKLKTGTVCPTTERWNYDADLQCYDKTIGIWVSLVGALMCFVVTMFLVAFALMNSWENKRAAEEYAKNTSLYQQNQSFKPNNDLHSIREQERALWQAEKEELGRRMDRRFTGASHNVYGDARPYYESQQPNYKQWELNKAKLTGVSIRGEESSNRFPPHQSYAATKKQIVASQNISNV